MSQRQGIAGPGTLQMKSWPFYLAGGPAKKLPAHHHEATITAASHRVQPKRVQLSSQTRATPDENCPLFTRRPASGFAACCSPTTLVVTTRSRKRSKKQPPPNTALISTLHGSRPSLVARSSISHVLCWPVGPCTPASVWQPMRHSGKTSCSSHLAFVDVPCRRRMNPADISLLLIERSYLFAAR